MEVNRRKLQFEMKEEKWKERKPSTSTNNFLVVRYSPSIVHGWLVGVCMWWNYGGNCESIEIIAVE